MKEMTKVRIIELVRKQVEPREELYERYFSSVADVTNFFLTAAKLFKEDRGLDDEEIVAIVQRSIGNYLLGKKYGVTPRQFVRNVMDARSEQR